MCGVFGLLLFGCFFFICFGFFVVFFLMWGFFGRWFFWWWFLCVFFVSFFSLFPKNLTHFKIGHICCPKSSCESNLAVFLLAWLLFFLLLFFQSETKCHTKFYYFHSATCDNKNEPLPLLPRLFVLSGKHLILTLASPTCVHYSAAYWYIKLCEKCVKLILMWEILLSVFFFLLLNRKQRFCVAFLIPKRKK